ncbi:MAG: hypothetical protein KTR25_05900 [Myxococcales bacterium]|nr:hypothetical protein [Myxococcales bacterium]
MQRHTGISAPPPLRMMAAKGLAPLPPRDLVTAQFILSFDEQPKIAQAASASLAALDPRIAKSVLSDSQVDEAILGHLSLLFAASRDAYIEPLLLNPSTPGHVFEDVAAVCTESIVELIARNQARLLEYPDIVRGLLKNPHALKSTIDRCIDFLIRSGIILEGLREFEHALLRLDAKDRIEAVSQIAVPPELLDDKLLAEAPPTRAIIDEQTPNEDLNNLPIDERLRRLSLPALIAYATKGNKQIRKTLMRHTSRIVALAAVTSPMIQEPEVIEASQSKVTHQDVIAHIAKDKKNNWIRIYQVKLGLVKNPKTPLPVAMRLVPLLNTKDIKLLARSRNIPAGVRTLASKLASSRGRN